MRNPNRPKKGAQAVPVGDQGPQGAVGPEGEKALPLSKSLEWERVPLLLEGMAAHVAYVEDQVDELIKAGQLESQLERVSDVLRDMERRIQHAVKVFYKEMPPERRPERATAGRQAANEKQATNGGQAGYPEKMEALSAEEEELVASLGRLRRLIGNISLKIRNALSAPESNQLN